MSLKGPFKKQQMNALHGIPPTKDGGGSTSADWQDSSGANVSASKEACFLAEAIVEAYLESCERGEWPDLTSMNPPGILEFLSAMGWDFSDSNDFECYDHDPTEAAE